MRRWTIQGRALNSSCSVDTSSSRQASLSPSTAPLPVRATNAGVAPHLCGPLHRVPHILVLHLLEHPARLVSRIAAGLLVLDLNVLSVSMAQVQPQRAARDDALHHIPESGWWRRVDGGSVRVSLGGLAISADAALSAHLAPWQGDA